MKAETLFQGFYERACKSRGVKKPVLYVRALGSASFEWCVGEICGDANWSRHWDCGRFAISGGRLAPSVEYQLFAEASFAAEARFENENQFKPVEDVSC